MKLAYKTGGNITLADLDQLAVTYSGIVNIGRKCKEVWNTIAIEDDSIDPFQCNLIGAVGGSWRLTHGQNRINCPKGLISNKTIPCGSCMGRCVGVHPGKAKYSQRTPEVPTMINGNALSKWGNQINVGDTISFGNVEISVVE